MQSKSWHILLTVMSHEVPALLLPEVNEKELKTPPERLVSAEAEPRSGSDHPQTTASDSRPLSIRIPKHDKGKQRAISPPASRIAGDTKDGKRRATSPSGHGPSRKIRAVSGPRNAIIKMEEPQVTFMDIDTTTSGVDARTRRQIRYQEIENDETDEEDTSKEDDMDELGDDDSSRKVKYSRPPIIHNGVIPAAGTKLRTDLLTCDRCWSKDLLCVRQQPGQACKACRTLRSKCSRVLPSCPRRRNLTEEDELRWRVLGIEPARASAVRARSRSQIRRKRASSEYSTRNVKRNVGARRHVKAEEEDDEDEESERGGHQQQRNRVSNRPVSWTRRGRVVGFGRNPPSRSSSSGPSDGEDNKRAALLEGRMSQIEIAMKDSAKTQKQLAKSMKEMSTALLKMSSEMVHSSSRRSSSDPEMVRQLRQLTARSHAITEALDNQGLPLPKDEDDNNDRGPSLQGITLVADEVTANRKYKNIRLQATPLMFEKAVQAGGDNNPLAIHAKIPEIPYAYEASVFKSPIRRTMSHRHCSVPLPSTSVAVSTPNQASYALFTGDIFPVRRQTPIKDAIMSNPWLEDEVLTTPTKNAHPTAQKEDGVFTQSNSMLEQELQVMDVDEEETSAATPALIGENPGKQGNEEFKTGKANVAHVGSLAETRVRTKTGESAETSESAETGVRTEMRESPETKVGTETRESPETLESPEAKESMETTTRDAEAGHEDIGVLGSSDQRPEVDDAGSGDLASCENETESRNMVECLDRPISACNERSSDVSTDRAMAGNGDEEGMLVDEDTSSEVGKLSVVAQDTGQFA